MAKIAIVGCGAMGSVYAALMVDAGHEVHTVTLWPDHAEAGHQGPALRRRQRRPHCAYPCLHHDGWDRAVRTRRGDAGQ